EDEVRQAVEDRTELGDLPRLAREVAVEVVGDAGEDADAEGEELLVDEEQRRRDVDQRDARQRQEVRHGTQGAAQARVAPTSSDVGVDGARLGARSHDTSTPA